MNHPSPEGRPPFFKILVSTLTVLLSHTQQKYNSFSAYPGKRLKCLNTTHFATPVNSIKNVYFLDPSASFFCMCGQITSLFYCVYGSMATKRVALPQRRQRGGKKVGGGGVSHLGWKKVRKTSERKQKEPEIERQKWWRRTTLANLSWSCFLLLLLLLLEGGPASTCGNNHPANDSW